MPRTVSRSPSYRRRHSPSPVGHRYSRRSRRDRSRSPYSSYSHSRRRSGYLSPRRHKSRSSTPWHRKRQKRRSTSQSPVKKSCNPSIGSKERKNVIDKSKIEEEEKKREPGTATMIPIKEMRQYQQEIYHGPTIRP